MPRVSVICATYNRGPAIRATIHSVCAQSVRDLEMIVVSDGSTDETEASVEEICKRDPRVRLIRIDRFGHPSRAMNVGMAAATGEVIAYIDHDDLWNPEHLETVLAQFDRGADIVATGSTWIDESGGVISQRPAAALFWHPEIQVMFPVFENSQAAHRAEWPDRVGPWSESSHGLEDWDMWLRFSDAGARFVTVADRTVNKTMAVTNRHRRLPKAHTLELARFPDIGTARAALRALMQPAVADELAIAGHADMISWYCRLARTDRFVFPVGFADDRRAAMEQIPAALDAARESDRGLEDPVRTRLAPADDGVAIVQEINCMTAEHARRYQAMARVAQARQFEIIERVTASLRTAPAA